MLKVDKVKKIAIVVLTVSFLCFFILLFGRKYDLLLNIFKLLCLVVFLITAATWLIMKLIKDYKNHENIKTILMSCLGLLLCVFLLPFLSLVSNPQSNILDIDRSPYVNKKNSIYDNYSNLIYSTGGAYDTSEINEISVNDSLLELQFIETYEKDRAGNGLFVNEGYHGFEIIEHRNTVTLSNLKITYDANHQILLYDLQRTRVVKATYEANEMYIYISKRLTVTNTYSSSNFTSVRTYYDFKDISDTLYSLENITHREEFEPDEILYSTISSTRNRITTNNIDYDVLYEYFHYADTEAHVAQINASQIIENDSSTITILNEYRLRTIDLNTDQISVSQTVYATNSTPETYIIEKYKKFDEIFVMYDSMHDWSDGYNPQYKTRVYRSVLNDDIGVEFLKDTSLFVKIKKTNYGYYVAYYDCSPFIPNLDFYPQRTNLYGMDFELNYLDYGWIITNDLGNRYKYTLPFSEFIYPSLPIFTFV